MRRWFRGLQEPACYARGAGVVVRVMKSRTSFFDVRARIRPLSAFEQRRERQEYLSDREKENRRTPECTGKESRMRHEGHTRGSVVGSGSQSQLSAAQPL